MTVASSSWRPARRPGSRILRRDADHLQVGTSPGVVVADRPGIRRLLNLADGRRTVRELSTMVTREVELDVPAAVTELVALGALLPLPPVAPPTPLVELVVADPRSRGLAEAVEVVGRRLGWRHGISHRAVLLVLSCGEPPRRPLELARQLGRAALPVALDELRVRVGPFVVPTATPCLECLDRERTHWDRAWPALLAQLDSAPGLPSPPAAPVVAHWTAAALIGAELARFAAGETPRSAGAVLHLGEDPTAIERREVPFHPECPCRLLPAA